MTVFYEFKKLLKNKHSQKFKSKHKQKRVTTLEKQISRNIFSKCPSCPLPTFPSLELKRLSLFLVQRSEPILNKERDFSQS